MSVEARIAHIGQGLSMLGGGWPFLMQELDQRIAELTAQLIHADNEQTRGRLKQLADIKNLPYALQAEREGLSAALSEQDAAE